MLQAKHIDVFYGASQALMGVDLEANKGEITCILGRNGVGKTSLMQAITGRHMPSAGSVFWEGVDIPGPALSCVVIARIPFAVPNDPIISARSETFDDPFSQYSIPQAILMFRQGFGRLIRSKDDRGVVAIFDKRVISKSYGQTFLDSLPTVAEHRGSVTTLPTMAENWIDYGGF